MPEETGIALPERTVTAGDHQYTAVSDLVCRHQLIVALQIVDTGNADSMVRGPLRIEVRSPAGVWANVIGDGFVAIAADVAQTFPELDTTDYSVELVVHSVNFRSQTRTISVPAGGSLPLAQEAVGMIPRPITLCGRINSTAIDHAPIPDAVVMSDEPRILALRTTLGSDHAAGAEVREVSVNLQELKTLESAVSRGATIVRTTDRQALVAGDWLRLGGAGRFEFARIADLPAEPADLTQPGDVELTQPLSRSFAAGVNVNRVQLVDGANASTLTSNVFAGTAVLETTTDMTADTLRIEPLASADVEVAEIGALSDALGYYRLDGWDRPTALDLRASASFFDDEVVPWKPNYSTRKNIVDIAMEPS